METRARHFWIGLATLAMILGGILFGVWLTDSDLYGERQRFEIVFDEDVGGLSPRSPVKFNGINVGEIDHLGLDPDNPGRVIARITVSGETPVRTDTRAQIGSSSLFAGGAHIRLKPGDPDAPPLEPPEQGLARIETESSPMARLREDSDQLLAGINNLVETANQLLSAENLDTLTATLNHLEQTTGAVAARRDDLGRGITALADGGEQAERTLQEAQQLVKEVRGLLDGPGREILHSTARATEALEGSSREAQELFRDNREAVERGLQSLQDLEPLSEELQRTLGDLRSLLRRLGQDPGGQLLRREQMEEYQP
ncbi:MlaD family protein [Halorhodospira halophila]|uniref:Mammalian cell entry related domain protein n=1 Tax=Halorhodospira halophila (strain DSM 244 / SL1) TaxID=349124 RepID=A1WY43_HALHL|nr:MlaD family protein [Halorhodospira halophila]ABM62605.1 Mammalian cell entry related domain protein [Halorhodospira halophila SL1]MBK1728285.1 MCE family protein [Halorhodospira halophila]